MQHVAMDKTWIHHYTPESNWQSAKWTAKGENRPKRPKTQMSAGKVLTYVFWDAHGILFIDYLEKGRTTIANIKRFSNRDITILSMNKTQKYLRYCVQIYCECSASITFYE